MERSKLGLGKALDSKAPTLPLRKDTAIIVGKRKAARQDGFMVSSTISIPPSDIFIVFSRHCSPHYNLGPFALSSREPFTTRDCPTG
ncbi:Hypothetical protein NTJ_10321 [Nesidiocoris tenuis]|uniref:Uncharacterized protein n=1 Tax=Nesidiocoris tenuis TaxID=355587 RepID=A0ABN7B436_9HEMI|nr:Hypothetical protein NTJ_10321 [Nesidiocoris tenuis]